MSMQSLFTISLQNRKAYKKLLESFTIEQLNQIPQGFSNNIAWNAAHIIAVQQRIIYGLAQVPYAVEESFVNEFNRGTHPTRHYDETFIQQIGEKLQYSFEMMTSDFEAGKFKEYTPTKLALNFEVNDFETALTFNLFHESLHMGQIMTLRKFVGFSN